MRFELTDPLRSLVFKTSAIDHSTTLPLNLVEPVGLEPTMPEAEDLQSPGVTNFPTTPNY